MMITFIVQFMGGAIIGALLADIIQAQPWFYPGCNKIPDILSALKGEDLNAAKNIEIRSAEIPLPHK